MQTIINNKESKCKEIGLTSSICSKYNWGAKTGKQGNGESGIHKVNDEIG